MTSKQDACTRCGTHLTPDEPHVWLELQSADLDYAPIDRTQLLCEDCYEDYREFLQTEH